jgi:ATP-binding cassette subfamily A (ABC1) protein 3
MMTGSLGMSGAARVPPQPSTASFLPATNVLTYQAWHNTTWKHGVPTAINLMNSAAYASSMGDATASITTRTHPLPYTLRQNNLISAFFTFSSAIIIVMAFAFFPASVAIFVTKEREVSAKHQQLISGVSIPAYWLSNYAFDLITYVVPSAVVIGLTKAFAISEFTSADYNRINAFTLLFVFYGTCVTPFTYVLSFLFKSHSTAQNVSLIIGIISLVIMIAALIMSQVESTCRADVYLRFIWRFLPGFSLGNGLLSLSFLSQLPLIDSTCDLFAGIYRPISSYQPYDAFHVNATGYNIIYLAVLSPVYLLLAILIDLALAHPRFRLLFSGKTLNVVDIPEVEDEDVERERERVAAQVPGAAGGGVIDVVQLRSLRKVFGAKTAVRNLSFGMPVGEVFGFLGINGAGKTTTLQMLSGDVLPTAGTALLGGYDIIRQQPDVRRLLGYCPQWDALIENMTAREHLELYARIKGVPELALPATVKASLEAMDLTQFANKLAQRLSGGNKRKLSVAIALIGSPPILFLDEPSTGMDPVAKRFMWSVIARVAKAASIVLTTHSMEEVEALCTRIGIMVGGRLRCLGSSQHLKNRHGQGFVTELRLLAPTADAVEAVEARVAAALGNASGAPALWMPRSALARVCAALGRPEREAEMSETGTGWSIAAAFAASSYPSPTAPVEALCVTVAEFAAWWAAEEGAARLEAYVCVAAFPGALLLERQGPLLRFRLPPNGGSLASMFGRMEVARSPVATGGCGVASYTLGQTSLEQIFVEMAGQQDEEKNIARGMRAAGPAAPGRAPHDALHLGP